MMINERHSIYQTFSRFSKEQVDDVINTLTESEKCILKLKFNDLDIIGHNHVNVSNIKPQHYATLIAKIKRRLDNEVKPKRKYWQSYMSIYEYFNEYSREQIDNMICKLTLYDKKILLLRCGDNLDVPVISPEMTKKDKRIFSRYLVPRMENMLKNPSKQYNRNLSKYKVLTIYEYFMEYSKEQVDNVLGKLNEEERHLLELKFSSSIAMTEQEKMTTEQIRCCYKLLTRLKKLLQEPSLVYTGKSGKPMKSIYQNFNNYSKEQVDYAIQLLTDDERNLLTTRYGNDLSNPIYNPEWNKQNYYDFYKRLMPKLKKILGNPTYGMKKTRGPIPLYKYFNNYTKEQVDKMLTKLTEEEQRLLYLKYGFDLEHPITSPNMTEQEKISFQYILQNRMANLLENQDKRIKRNRSTALGIYGYFNDISKEIVDKAIEQLTVNEINILKQNFGENFNQKKMKKLVLKEDNYNVYKILKKLKSLIVCLENGNTYIGRKAVSIYSYFSDYTKEQINQMLEMLTENEKELVRLKYGQDLEKPFTDPAMTDEQKKQFYHLLTIKMKNLLKIQTLNGKTNGVDKNSLTRIELERMKKLLKTPQFLELLHKYSTKDAIVLFMKFKNCISKCFSDEAIASFLGIEVNEVREILKKYLLSQKNIITNNFSEAVINGFDDNQKIIKK